MNGMIKDMKSRTINGNCRSEKFLMFLVLMFIVALF